METPIAFFIFRRPEQTVLVFEQIRKIKPLKLFVVADGGRNAEEWEKCNSARKVIEGLDWSCEVIKNYSDKNLGCKFRVSSGLDWVFDNVERAIILEDDTLPNQSFFRFAEELLGHYKDNQEIMHISGINFQQKNPEFRSDASYYFSKVPQIWGWATWRRAWKSYDVFIERWPEVKKSRLLCEIFRNPAVADYWEYRFSEVYSKRDSKDPTETWDSQWVFACLLNGGLSINPAVNLITNIGAGSAGTQTKNQKEKRLSNIPLVSMEFPLRHPEKIEINKVADVYSFRYVWGINLTLKQKLISFFKFRTPFVYKIFRKVYRSKLKRH